MWCGSLEGHLVQVLEDLRKIEVPPKHMHFPISQVLDSHLQPYVTWKGIIHHLVPYIMDFHGVVTSIEEEEVLSSLMVWYNIHKDYKLFGIPHMKICILHDMMCLLVISIIVHWDAGIRPT